MNAPGSRPKRFYKTVSVEESENGFQIFLDGRGAKTLKRFPLVAPNVELASAIMREWKAQEGNIDRYAMPLTALLSAAIDGSRKDETESAAEILNYLGADLLCYRANEPQALVERQKEVWDSYLEWFEREFSAKLKVAAGVIALSQPAETIEKIGAALEKTDAPTLLALKTATAITGSAVLALALWKSAFDPEDIFEASRLDERFQEERWGVDAEAKEREDRMRGEFAAVAQFFSLL